MPPPPCSHLMICKHCMMHALHDAACELMPRRDALSFPPNAWCTRSNLGCNPQHACPLCTPCCPAATHSTHSSHFPQLSSHCAISHIPAHVAALAHVRSVCHACLCPFLPFLSYVRRIDGVLNCMLACMSLPHAASVHAAPGGHRCSGWPSGETDGHRHWAHQVSATRYKYSVVQQST